MQYAFKTDIGEFHRVLTRTDVPNVVVAIEVRRRTEARASDEHVHAGQGLIGAFFQDSTGKVARLRLGRSHKQRHQAENEKETMHHGLLILKSELVHNNELNHRLDVGRVDRRGVESEIRHVPIRAENRNRRVAGIKL